MSPRAVALSAAAVLAALALGVLGVAAAGFHHDGGRWFAIVSPSMGEAVPRGSLVLTRPTTVAQVADGEMITFRSPGSGKTYTHRVVAHGPDGLSTQGDVNLVADAWTISDANMIGRVVWHAPGIGWAMRGVPLLVAGLLLTLAVSAGMRTRRRHNVQLIGASATVAATSWLLQPWVGLDRLSQTTPDDGSSGVLLEVVSTGLLPIRAFEIGGDAGANLHNGQVATIHLGESSSGMLDLAARLDLGLWGWIVLVALLASPLWGALVWAALPDRSTDPDSDDHRSRRGDRAPAHRRTVRAAA